MPGGYVIPANGSFGELEKFVDQTQQQIREIGRPTGTQTAGALEKLRQLIDDLPDQIYAVLATAVNTGSVNATGNVAAGGSVNATGNVAAGGSGTFPAGINSTGVYNLDVSTLPGGRRTGWVHVSGALGYAPSTIETKDRVGLFGATAMQFLNCMPVVFEYMAQADIRDNPANPYYDPDYVVPTEVGHLAELLMANGLEDFVFWDEGGAPAGINMAEFAAVGFVVVGRNHEARLRAAGL